MSWMSENYHKAALGGGVVVLAAVGFLSWSSASEKQEILQSDLGGGDGQETSSQGGVLADSLVASLREVKPLEQATTSGGRAVDLFNSVDLFLKDGDIRKTLDLLQVDDVHPGIPNKWWVANAVDPSYSDSPDQDKDGDGFTNGEEFAAETDPSDPKSYGLLASKLVVDGIDSQWWFVQLNSGFGNGKYQFRYENENKESTRMRASEQIEAGQVFFPAGPAKGRFKAVEEGNRQVQGANGRMETQKYYIIEDLSENKRGMRYEAPYRPRRGTEPFYYQFDNTVTFILDAVGQEGQQHTVKENESFSVSVDGKKLTYRLVKVDMGERPGLEPQSVHVEFTTDQGAREIRIIPVK